MKVTVTYEVPTEVIEELIRDAKEHVFDENTYCDEATNYILDLLDEYITDNINYNHYDDLTVNAIQDLLCEGCEHKSKENDNKVNETEKLYLTLKTVFGEEHTWR